MAQSEKQRLDQYLLTQHLAKDMRLARSYIMQGLILVNGQKMTKPGYLLKGGDRVDVARLPSPYVSRGGEKLAGALAAFALDPTDAVALDIGISTGGFSDCLLQHGAKIVLGVDVGYGLVDGGLRNHTSLVLLERVNARNLDRDQLDRAFRDAGHHMLASTIDMVVMDVSFISVMHILPGLRPLVSPDCHFVCLVKPQFEARKVEIPDGGIIVEEALRQQILERVSRQLAEFFDILGIYDAPITGKKGNQETFLWMRGLS